MPAAINWTPELEEAICDKLAEGEYLTDICESKGFPTYKSVRKHIAESEEFSKRIARASEEQADHFRWRISSLNDKMNADNWQFRNAQIRNIQWLMGKVKPKAYGERVQQDISGEIAVKRVVSDL